MADAEIEVGIDGQKFKRGLDELRAKARQFGAEVAKDTGGGFFGLEGDNKVKRNLAGIVQELTNAETAAQALAGALGRMENIFASSIGVGVAVAVLGTMVNKLVEAQDAWNRYKEAGVEAWKQIDLAISSGKAEEALDKIKKRLEEVENRKKKLSTMVGNAADFWASTFAGEGMKDKQTRQVAAEREKYELLKKNLLGEQQYVALKEQEAAMEKLRASGDKEAVAAMQLQQQMLDEIYELKKKGFKETQLEQDAIIAIAEKYAAIQQGRDKERDDAASAKASAEAAAAKAKAEQEAAKAAEDLARALEEQVAAEDRLAEFGQTDEQALETAEAIVAQKTAELQITTTAIDQAKLKKEIAEQNLIVVQKMAAINDRNVEQQNAEIDAAKAKLEVMKAQQEVNEKNQALAEMIGNQNAVEQGQTRAGRLGQWTLPEQRAIERNIANDEDRKANIVARDWAREKFQKRIDDLNENEKAQMAKFKEGVLGQGGWEKDIANTRKAIEDLLDVQKKFSAKIGIK